jgi:hypothetical protein
MRLRPRFSVGLAVVAAGLATVAIVVPRTGPDGAAAAVSATQAADTATVPYIPYPTIAGTLYVDNAAKANCSDTGPGTESQPFCTIGATASLLHPGQTVVVEPGTYTGSVTISAQGTSLNPVTFDAIEGAIIDGSSSAPAFSISGARDVVLDGFSAFNSGAHQDFYVTGSSGITINGGAAGGNTTVPAVEVDGTSSDVTVSRMAVDDRTGVQVDPGASGVVITSNSIIADQVNTWGVVVNGAPGTDVTSNTFRGVCSGGISITGASAGVSVENNIVQPQGDACTVGTGISVSADSEASSVVKYNLIDPSAGEPLYDWGGTPYDSVAGFQAASGQGAHDIAANPDLGTSGGATILGGDGIFWFPLEAGSPAIDSADANAPGELISDQLGSPRADDPSVANTGTGAGYYDRGAVELEGGSTLGSAKAVSSGPLTATFTLAESPVWTSNDSPVTSVQVNFGDGTPVDVGQTKSFQHTYAIAGQHTVQYFAFTGCCGSQSATTEVVVGADYSPGTSVRILDTRDGTGTGKASPVAANGTLTLTLPEYGDIAPADMSAVVMNVTVTSPKKNGNLTVYPGSGSEPAVSNVNFSAGQTVANLVTVKVSNGQVSFHNNSAGTAQVVADLEGVYGPKGEGYGYSPGTPARVLDTRSGIGGTGPVPAHGVLRLDLSGTLISDTGAVVINLTATDPAKNGYLTAYPDEVPAPDASNLNFTAGKTVANLVIVPVLGDDVVDIKNNSGGTVQMVADLEGYFASSSPDSFVPVTPARELDTRTAGSPLGAGKAVTMNILTDANQAADAMVDNVTVTAPAKDGNLIVYPAGQARPGVSNLNFRVNETVPNLVMAKAGTNAQVSYYNNSPGQLQLIVDEYGYFINGG